MNTDPSEKLARLSALIREMGSVLVCYSGGIDSALVLAVAARDSGSKVRRHEDTYGYTWLTIEDPDFEDLVTSTHLVSSELQARGFGEQLLAALFRFEGGRHPVYLLYSYKRAKFWPFIPTGEDQKRDNAEEIRLKNELEKELPMEEDLSRWFGLFDSPV